ncbi:hypothetical protein SPRG_12785 [Saprolegnia parasitica CBS 223.65]|uniref:Uncharacterized protein n=1 Tax=Saprolegnia parasitica (strain CBS 223.65) TaxID=695850 RepID=A0A067BZP6_SAPPC|nr:hypothetical protein SPRG_12785 [Saprolegnia parasitica CBS 223.65]KDO22325.1 hypothetical protein SPRG_12785 [Saprolegnia parasitica CBS 223.65]|eukprot:XP_012206959.1 hypothetical protein SPRG_12785 [Saprolegnia parasitica CBS 223.65]
MADAATAELLLAVAAGDVPRVRAALADGADVNARNEADATPLDVACGEDRLDVVTCLLAHHRMDVAKASPMLLWTVCERGAGAMVAQLLAHPTTNPMTLLPSGWNVLFALCSTPRMAEMLSLFVDHPRVDWNVPIHGETPLQRAVQEQAWHYVAVLLQDPRVHVNVFVVHGVHTCSRQKRTTLLHAACDANDADVVVALLRRPDINRHCQIKNQGTAFAWTVVRRNRAILELFLALPDDDINLPNNDGMPPLHLAIDYHDDDHIAHRLLCEPHLRRDATNALGNTALHMASQRGWTSLVEALLGDNVNVQNAAGDTPASVALLHGQYDLALRFYRDFGARVNTVMSNGLTPLLCACQHGHLALVRVLLASPWLERDVTDQHGNSAHMLACYTDPRVFFALWTIRDDEMAATNEVGRTILHVACEYGRGAVVAALLPRTMNDVNAPDADGSTPLLLACTSNHGAVVAQLLAVSEVDTDRADKVRNVLALRGHASVVAALLSVHANVHAIDNDGNTPLLVASVANHASVVAQLLSDHSVDMTKTNKDGRMALHVAARAGHVRVLQLLLEARPAAIDLRSADGTTALMEAVDHRKPGAVTFLLRHPCIDANAVDKDGNTALMRHCMRSSNYDVLEALLSSPKVDINRRNHAGATALALACHANDPMLAAQLMQRPQLDVSTIDASCGHIALAVACALQYVYVVRKLLSSPEMDVNYRDASGLTTLLQVCLNEGNVKIVHLLLERPEIDTSVRDKHGNSALILATRQGHPGIVRALLAHGSCHVNAVNDAGSSALHDACQARNAVDLVPLLLRSPSIDVNCLDKKGQTPLMVACVSAADAVIDLLLDHPRINVSTSGHEHFGPLQIAVRQRAVEVVTRLIQHPTAVVEVAYEWVFLAWVRAVNNQHLPLLSALAARVDVNKALVMPDRSCDDEQRRARMASARPGASVGADLRWMHPKVKVEWVASTNRRECADATVASCKTGKNALMVACLFSNDAMVDLLMSQPTIDVNAVDMVHNIVICVQR